MHPRLNPVRAAAPLLAISLVAACTQTSAPSSSAGPSGSTPSGLRVAEGAGCSGEIARFRAVIENDRTTGHVAGSVYSRMAAEVNRAAAACAAGRDAEAVAALSGTRRRYGYP